jgi:hypothetical protein
MTCVGAWDEEVRPYGRGTMKTEKDDRTPAERVGDTERILFEMSQAVREALAQHRRAGNPIAVWRNDRVEWIAAEDIPEELATLLPEWGSSGG